ncbi:phosphoribosylformylglycinamidine cyclo-ligase [Eubacteriales bacterium OttesenSCG-928-M02]|nr:phosphoribosylformylglycinamidine cyclo-ligase [Eubacteriales bacterium OttesenSCG-928-M02]
MPTSYKDAGVDVEAGYDAVTRIKAHAKRTYDKNVLAEVGSFGGFYSIKDYLDYEEPVLVSGTDGVGTKLKIAMAMDEHDTVGIDCVAMCVNDIVCHGAKPLYFLDYIAVGKLVPERAERIVKGVADGCEMAGCALIGGETAEMPDLYAPNEYDLAGFAVGIVDRPKVIDGSTIKEGDVLIGLASSGVHSNGFSLIRRVLGDDMDSLSRYRDDLGTTVGECLLTPTRIYVKTLLHMLKKVEIHGIANITGGGFIENIPRIIPDGLCARVELAKVPTQPIFDILEKEGKIPHREMYNIFNMGVSMVLAIPETHVEAAMTAAKEKGDTPVVMGRIIKGESKVELV